MIAISPSTLITFSLYLVTTMLLGWLGFRATRNVSDYILGGRRLGSFVTALSAGASDMSGWLLMGLPGAIYVDGLSGIWIAIGLVIGAWLNWHWVAARLRHLTEKLGNAETLPDYFVNRFSDTNHLLRLLSALAILIFFTFYCASGIVAGAQLFANMFGLPYHWAVALGAFATVFYVFIGGFLAVSWTDTLQASLMITALIIVPLMMIHGSGNWDQSLHVIQLSHPEHLNFVHQLTWVGLASSLAYGLGYFGQPHILVRFMAAKSPAVIPKARRICMIWMMLCLAGAVAVGFFGVGYFAVHSDFAAAVSANPETVFIEAAKHLFNPWVIGFLLAAILAAIMSTLSCQLLICSSTLTRDIYQVFFRKQASGRELMMISRMMVLLVAAVAILIASNPHSRVFNIVSHAWAGFGAAFGPVVLLSVLWSGMTRSGAIAGILTGTLTVLIWGHYNWLGLYEILPGFIFATFAIVGVSLLSQSSAKTRVILPIVENTRE
ncbi:MAG: sodium/proline symporter PutP [Gammaproteobacteria bacterium]